MSDSFTKCEAFKLILPPFSQRGSWHINPQWLAGWLKEKQECEWTLDSLFALQLPHSSPPFNVAPLYISPWQLQCVRACVCVRVCLRWISWFPSHKSSWLEARSDGFSASSEWSSRHWEQWSHWTQWFQGGSGRRAIQPSVWMSLTICASCNKPMEKFLFLPNHRKKNDNSLRYLLHTCCYQQLISLAYTEDWNQ